MQLSSTTPASCATSKYFRAPLTYRAAAHAEATDLALGDIVDYRLHETMNPFSFQVISVWHHRSVPSRACVRENLTRHPTSPGLTMRGSAI